MQPLSFWGTIFTVVQPLGSMQLRCCVWTKAELPRTFSEENTGHQNGINGNRRELTWEDIEQNQWVECGNYCYISGSTWKTNPERKSQSLSRSVIERSEGRRVKCRLCTLQHAEANLAALAAGSWWCQPDVNLSVSCLPDDSQPLMLI